MDKTIYISSSLKNLPEGALVAYQLYSLPNIKIKEIISDSGNIWCRDFMPVKGNNGNYVLFKYNPVYMRGFKKYKDLYPLRESLINEFSQYNIISSDLILDGGAIEIFNDTAFVSEQCIIDNSTFRKDELIEQLKQLLGLKRIIFIPAYPWDFTKHLDGLIRFVDSETVIINDFTEFEKKLNAESVWIQRKYYYWKQNFTMIIENAGFKIKKIIDASCYNSNLISAQGIYLNFLKMENKILMPAFAHEKDDETASETLFSVYNLPIVKIQSKQLSQLGGVINCVTWGNG